MTLSCDGIELADVEVISWVAVPVYDSEGVTFLGWRHTLGLIIRD